MASRRLLPGPDARQGLVALGLNSSTGLLAGAILGSLVATFEARPGLLLLVPAATGMRGNIFGSLGNRVSTSIHAGELTLALRRSSLLGQYVLAASSLTIGMSVVLVVLAPFLSWVLDLGPTIGLADLAVVSIGGGAIASLPVLVATLGLAAGAVRYGWDLDNVTAPLVSTLGDVLTLPALWLATGLLGFGLLSTGFGWVLVLVSIAALGLGATGQLPHLRRIVRQSLPILLIAACVGSVAGVLLERRIGTFAAWPALLVLIPAHLSSGGALGGILSGRLASKLHLGLAPPTAVPSRAARADIGLVVGLAVVAFTTNGVGAHLVARALGVGSPGIGSMVAASLIGGAAVMAIVITVAYYGTIAAVRLNLDPDSFGIPLVTSTIDLAGTLTLLTAISVLGLA